MESKNEGDDEEAAEIQSAEDDQGEAQVEEQEQDEDIREEKVGWKTKRKFKKRSSEEVMQAEENQAAERNKRQKSMPSKEVIMNGL